MTRSITKRIASLGLAAVAVTAIGGTVSGARDESTTCRTWHPHTIVSGRHQHTWNPDDATDGRHQHTWNPADTVDGRYQHTWNPDSDRSDACASPSRTTP